MVTPDAIAKNSHRHTFRRWSSLTSSPLRVNRLLAILHLLFSLGIFGLITSTVYSVMVVAGVFYFRNHRPGTNRPFIPAVSLLKPLHGAEPNLAEHLEGFSSRIIPHTRFSSAHARSNDAGLKIARQVAARYPSIPARFVTSGEPPFANAKVASLDRMAQAAQYRES